MYSEIIYEAIKAEAYEQSRKKAAQIFNGESSLIKLKSDAAAALLIRLQDSLNNSNAKQDGTQADATFSSYLAVISNKRFHGNSMTSHLKSFEWKFLGNPMMTSCVTTEKNLRETERN